MYIQFIQNLKKDAQVVPHNNFAFVFLELWMVTDLSE